MPRGPAARELGQIALVLDADGLTKLARRDRRVREMVRQVVVESRGVVVVPTVVVIQALVERSQTGAISEIVEAAIQPVLDRERVRLAADLLIATSTRDVPDAVVAAEALLRVPSIVITSDPIDLR